VDVQQLTKRINFLLGKNGCGKSSTLRKLDNDLAGNANWFVKYITPERGGSLAYDAGIEQSITNTDTWLRDTRRTNRYERFREQTVSQFRNLELLVLRDIEKTEKVRANHSYTFESVIEQINALLPLVRLTRGLGAGFEILRRTDNERVQPQAISSGESEAIALAIEALVFSAQCQSREGRLLLIDEPDVHLHPDLQVRYVRFLENLAREKDFKVVIATHSTSMVGALQHPEDVQIAFMPLTTGAEIIFSPVNDIAKAVLPIFGAHPLSNVFNESPILLVEGDDDRRIWDQVVRSTEGVISLFPCPTGSIDKIAEWETWLVDKLPSLYDDPQAFSLRDRDESQGDLEDRPPVIRCRLACRAAENLILADDTLAMAGTTWEKVMEGCTKWLENFPDHTHFAEMRAFVDSGFDRFNADLKEIRNILLAVMGETKPWEVLVGQAIAALGEHSPQGAHSLSTYLGKKVCFELLDL
jgi:energy-coupling factor transporter ATP-binding protein EcfA2